DAAVDLVDPVAGQRLAVTAVGCEGGAMARPVRLRVEPERGFGEDGSAAAGRVAGIRGPADALFELRPQDEGAGADAERGIGVVIRRARPGLDGGDALVVEAGALLAHGGRRRLLGQRRDLARGG